MGVAGRVCGLFLVFVAVSFLLFLGWSFAPDLHGPSPRPARFPHSIEELKTIAKFLSNYRDEHYVYTLMLFSAAYLYKQAFAIPGSFFMNLLGGALFGRWLGSAIVCPLTAIGASFCYMLSASFARPIVEKFFRKKIRTLRITVRENEHRLFFFLLCARFFPFTPHWLLNICSPFLDIDLLQFFASVFIGLIPYNMLCVRAGGALAELHSVGDVFDSKTLFELLSIAALMGIFGIVAKKGNRRRNPSFRGVSVSED